MSALNSTGIKEFDAKTLQSFDMGTNLTFDSKGLKGLDGVKTEAVVDRAKDPTPEMLGNVSLLRKVGKRKTADYLGVANATDHIKDLPPPGHTLHCITKGNYCSFDIVPATLAMIKPGHIDELYIATLGFSQKNVADLFTMLDSGAVKKVRVICSCYFRSTSAEIFNPMVEGLTSRGHKIVAMRNHAKLILMRTSTGQDIAIESSANLRSCRNVEQFSISNDAGLFDFHARWMNAVAEDQK